MITRAYDSLTRGERNNNPGNIDKSSASWVGKVIGSDSRFETFSSPEYGIRALGKNLLTYQDKYGLNTITGIINRWAPGNENDTNSYILAVSGQTGFGPNEPLNLHDAETLAQLVRAIIRHENGRVIYEDTVIAKSVEMALA